MIKRKNKISPLRCIYTIVCFLIPLACCFFTIKINKKISSVSILTDEFMLNFLGAILGLGITIITFIYSSIEKIRETILKLNANKSDDVISRVRKVFEKLKQDLLFIFLLFFFSFVVSIFKDGDIPFIRWNYSMLNKSELIVLIKLYILSLTFIAVFDIVMTLFSLLKASDEVTKK